MNEKELQSLVDNAVALHREIAQKTEQLKALKAVLVKEARRHPKALVATENGGKRWTTKGSDGCLARVNFPAAALVSEIEAQSDLAKQLQDIAGGKFRRLFTTVKSYQLAENFRAEAAAILPERKAEALVALCENESAPRVSFEAASLSLAAVAAA
ncbi:MAG: hypothetical protein ABJF10_11485 [Chthoniobacter sp.]|uniref:hypothetical protein n=1 Tax=Chthoniobacter sp. TaxID=2510640 RepID=UPI0032A9EF67